MKVFSFRLFYGPEEGAQMRYVAAECESDAYGKLYIYLAERIASGGACPTLTGGPTVEIDNVIV